MQGYLKKPAKRLYRYYQTIYYRYFTDYVFIHINKTGGSSIEHALGIPYSHMTAMEYAAEIGSKAWDERFSFAFVRNPWEKVVSQYHYRVKTNQTNLSGDSVGFNDWVRLAYRDKDPGYYNNQKMFMPQTGWISDASGEVIVDFVGRYENLHDDFNHICRHIGKAPIPLPVIRKSNHVDYRECYSVESRKIIEDWFSQDIDLFEYRF